MSDVLDQLVINTIRTPSIDATQQANSGHPGTPMLLTAASMHRRCGVARGAYVLADAP